METNKNTQASTVEEVSDNKSQKDTKDSIKDYLQKNLEIAQKIADLYLERFPREQSFGVKLVSSDDDSEMTLYHKLSEEELEILRKCSQIATEEECALDEILDEEGHDDLVLKLGYHDTPMALDIIDSIDLNNPLKYTKFSFQSLDEDGNLGLKRYIGAPLTDDEFKEILVELLLNENRYSMNMLVYRKPELCQMIIRHLTYASLDNQFENWNPYIADMSELKDICDQILNPFKDVLQLFNSDNKDFANFALRHQIVPDYENEIYADLGTDSFHCLLNFHGTRIDFYQEGYNSETEDFHDVESFSIEGKELMDKFSLESPKEILPYLKDHFSTPDCLSRIKKEFGA
jgi:hypothetical protein